jgi:hypothetical protein
LFLSLSETTTHEVIKALLKKFKVVDNPRKFALYERHYEQGETAKGEQHSGAMKYFKKLLQDFKFIMKYIPTL